MGENNVKVGKLFMKDMETGETFEFDGLKPIELEPVTLEPAAPDPEQGVLEQSVPDGINIHITGSEISRVSNIEIWFKEEE